MKICTVGGQRELIIYISGYQQEPLSSSADHGKLRKAASRATSFKSYKRRHLARMMLSVTHYNQSIRHQTI